MVALLAPLLAWLAPPAALRPATSSLPSRLTSAGLGRPLLPVPVVRMAINDSAPAKPRLAIEYCTRCNWLLRSAWLSQELLTTFNGTLAEVALQPNHVEGGVFTVRLDMGAGAGEELVWSRAEEGRFPESAELKRKVRDILAPEKHLGHSEDKYGVVDDRPPSARSAVSRLVSARESNACAAWRLPRRFEQSYTSARCPNRGSSRFSQQRRGCQGEDPGRARKRTRHNLALKVYRSMSTEPVRSRTPFFLLLVTHGLPPPNEGEPDASSNPIGLLSYSCTRRISLFG